MAPRPSAWVRGQPLASVAGSTEHFVDRRAGLFQGGRNSLGMFAAGLSQIGPAAAAATDDGRDFLDPISGAQAHAPPDARLRPATSSTRSSPWAAARSTAACSVFLRI